MAKLSVKLNILPGITRDIDITLEDLLIAFNASWSLEDRLELIMGLNLENSEDTGVKAIAKIFNNLDVDDLTIGQLLSVNATIDSFKTKIDTKKRELIKDKEN